VGDFESVTVKINVALELLHGRFKNRKHYREECPLSALFFVYELGRIGSVVIACDGQNNMALEVGEEHRILLVVPQLPLVHV